MTTGAPSRPSPAPPRARTVGSTSIDLVVLACVTILLRLPAFLAPRHLTFDDGVYGASAVALRDGGLPFRDVFSSQGPAFLPLVWLADLLGLHTINGPRLLGLASGVVLVLAVYLCGREVGDRSGARLAAGLTMVSGSVLWVTGPIASDGPALAAATTGVWLALRYRRAPSLRLAVGIGLGVGVALSSKLMAAPVLAPVALVLLATVLPGRPSDERSRVDGPALGRLLLAGACAGLVWLLPSLAFGLADVWDQSVTYHTEVSGGREPLDNVRKVSSTFVDRDTALFLVALLTLGAGLAGRLRGPRPPLVEPADPSERSADLPSGGDRHRTPSPEWHPSWLARLTPPTLLWAWLGATVVLLLYVHPLWRPHVSGLVPPIALLIACYRPPMRAAVAVAAVGVAAQLWFLAGSDDAFYFAPGGYEDDTAALVAQLDALPPGAWALSDDPGLVWRAGRRTTDDLVDASVLRIDSGRVTAESLTEAAADPRVCAVLVTSGVRWGSFDELPALLADVGYTRTLDAGGDRRAYVREDCDPPR
jgi:hypothetical protein